MKVKLATKMRALTEKSYDKNAKGTITYIERFVKYNAKRGLSEYVYYIDEDEQNGINWDCVEKHFERQGFKVNYISGASKRNVGFEVSW